MKNIIIIFALAALTAGAQRLRVGEHSSGMDIVTLQGSIQDSFLEHGSSARTLFAHYLPLRIPDLRSPTRSLSVGLRPLGDEGDACQSKKSPADAPTRSLSRSLSFNLDLRSWLLSFGNIQIHLVFRICTFDLRS